MRFVKGMLDYALAADYAGAVFLFTGNSYVKRSGALVMGRGAALSVRDQYPGIDRDIGCRVTHLGFYGLLRSREVQPNIGVFQVKYSAFEAADLDIINRSAAMLNDYAKQDPLLPIYLNFPGVGNGRLTQEQVWPYIVHLPDNVFIYSG